MHMASTARGTIDAGNDVQQCALAGTARPHERHELAGLNVQRYVVQCHDFDLAVAEHLRQVADVDDRFPHSLASLTYRNHFTSVSATAPATAMAPPTNERT